MYRDLSWLWPIVSEPRNYVSEASLISGLIKSNTRNPMRTLLHLGCGGGHLDKALKRRFNVTWVDISGQMIALARKLNPEQEYLRGDMRTIRLGRLFDAVVIDDSIDYMTTEEDLRRAFLTARDHLRQGGVFCTYAELTVERFEQNKTEVSTHKGGGVDVVFLENTYDPDPSDTQCEFTFVFLIKEDGILRVETDRHIAGLFRMDTWVEIMEDIGFKVRRCEYPGEGIPMFVCLKPL